MAQSGVRTGFQVSAVSESRRIEHPGEAEGSLTRLGWRRPAPCTAHVEGDRIHACQHPGQESARDTLQHVPPGAWGTRITPSPRCSPAELLPICGVRDDQSGQLSDGPLANSKNVLYIFLIEDPVGLCFPTASAGSEGPEVGHMARPQAPGPPDPTNRFLETVGRVGHTPTWGRPQKALLTFPTTHICRRQGRGPRLLQELEIVTEGSRLFLDTKGKGTVRTATLPHSWGPSEHDFLPGSPGGPPCDPHLLLGGPGDTRVPCR